MSTMNNALLATYQTFTDTTAIYPKSSQLMEAMYLALGLNGEAGEVAEKVKKWYRDGEIDKDEVKKELGDVLWYLTQMCNCFDMTLEEVLIANRDKLIDRANRAALSGSGDNR